MEKRNCWEIKKCGREEGGSKAEKLGVCPAAVDCDLNGLNNGMNAGRICWAKAGTMCDGNVEGLFAKNILSCMGCEVYKIVRSEEGLKGLTIKPG